MAINRTSPKKGKVVDIPDAVVTIGTPTAGDAQVSVAFTASSPATGGPVQKYTAISNPGSFTGTASTSPVVVTGLTNGTAYTFTVAAGNATGNGVFSSASASATPLQPTDFESIATTTVGAGGSSTITFSSIPSTYKHLQIRILARSNWAGQVTDYLKLRYNSDSGANYSVHVFYGDGSSLTALAFDNQSENWIQRISGAGATASVFGGAVVDILDYANTSKYKTMRNLGGIDNNGSGLIYLASGSWRNTAAISSITITAGAGTSLDQYSSFALYGVKG